MILVLCQQYLMVHYQRWILTMSKLDSKQIALNQLLLSSLLLLLGNTYIQ